MRNPLQRDIDFREGQLRSLGMSSGLRIADRGQADAAPPLARHARKVRDADRNLFRHEPAQKFRDAGDLRAPSRMLAHRLRGRDQIGKKRGGYGPAASRSTVARTFSSAERSAFVGCRYRARFSSAIRASREAMFWSISHTV